MLVTLRPYQQRGVEQLRAAYRKGKRAPLYVLPTGGGKTIVFSYISEAASARNKRVLTLVHRQELLAQASRSLEQIGVRHGLIAPGHSMTHSPVQVASVQTVVRRLERVTPPDLIVVDEAHHTLAGSWRKILDAFPHAAILGVTATPVRLDGVGLGVESGGVYDCMVLGPQVSELIRLGFLVRPQVFAPPQLVDLRGVRSRGGDYEAAAVAVAMDKPRITGDAVEHYRAHCHPRGGKPVPAIAFCASVQHADHVAEQFQVAGYRSVRLDGMMSDYDRRVATHGLANGHVHVLTSCDLVSEGFDCPVVGAAILLRPTKSMSLYLQQVGRALRPAPGKTKAIILDHVGNVVRHGLPDDEREWSLDGLPPEADVQDGEVDVHVRQCPRCYAAHSAALDVCPNCGHVYAVQARVIEEVAGQLTELNAEQIERLRRMKRGEVKQALTREALEALAAKRGYKRGWVDHMLRARSARDQRTNPFGRIVMHGGNE